MTKPTVRGTQRASAKAVQLDSATHLNIAGALTLTAAALALIFTALTAQAEITQDCILEGKVDMRKAEQLGQPVYVKFRKAESGPEAACAMNRRNKSRRVTFVSSPDMDLVENAAHGERVRYRYIERDNQPGTWELMEPGES